MSEELAVIEHEPPSMALHVAPQVEAAELVRRLNVIEDAMRTAMKQDVDYGVIPGTGTKPTLLKPGAEKLGALFQLDVQLDNEKVWHDDGHLTVVARATVYHQPTGARLGSGEGICTTREAKYAYRQASRVCPACGAAAIIKGKAEYGGGWLCFGKKGGCGAKYRDDEAAITGQPTGRVANDDLPDSYNTVDKMASKRARIDAVLAVTGASALFTQDIEDSAPDEGASHPAPAKGRDTPAADEAAVNASSAAPLDGDGFVAPHPPGEVGDRTEAQAKMLHYLLPKLVKAGALADAEFIAYAHTNGASGDGVNACIDSLSKVGASALISVLKELEKAAA